MEPDPEEHDATAGSYREIGKGRYTPNKRLEAWPWQSDKPDAKSSAVNCLITLMRHINKAALNDEVPQTEANQNFFQKFANFSQPLLGAESRKKLDNDIRKHVQIAAEDGIPTFIELEESTPMMKTMWSRPEQLLFHHLKKIGSGEWKVDEDYTNANGARQSIITIDQDRPRGKLDIPAIIEKHTNVCAVPDEPKSCRCSVPRPPSWVRIRYTPRQDDLEDFSSLSTFDMKLIPARDGIESNRYNLAAIVRSRDPQKSDEIDLIRVFRPDGYEILPKTSFAYNDANWRMGASGHTYSLYYMRNGRALVGFTESELLSRRSMIAERESNQKDARLRQSTKDFFSSLMADEPRDIIRPTRHGPRPDPRHHESDADFRRDMQNSVRGQVPQGLMMRLGAGRGATRLQPGDNLSRKRARHQ